MFAEKWQITAYIKAPQGYEIAEGEALSGDFPREIGLLRPLFDNVFSLKVRDHLHFNISPFVDGSERLIAGPCAPIKAVIYFCDPAVPADKVVSGVEGYLEDALDQLSFLWDYPVRAYRMELLDLTDPVKAGDIRSMMRVDNYDSPKFRTSDFHWVSSVDASQSKQYDELSDKVKGALRWYGIGVQRQPDAQRFTALWTALELLIDKSHEGESIPYVAPCQHQITHCPICQSPTAKRPGGAQIRAFLRQRALLSPELAGKLVKTRQMVHGAISLTPDEVRELPLLLDSLWNTVRGLLADELNMTVCDRGPNSLATSYFTIFGRREVTEADLDIELRTFPLAARPLRRVELSSAPYTPGRNW